jgi:hypothetical protein
MEFALRAGERRFETPEGGAGGPERSASGNGDPNAGQGQFDTGYGKGIEKGRREERDALLKELGVASADEAKALAKAARDADTAAKKAAEEQGQFRTLYETEKAAREKDAAERDSLRKDVEQFRAGQKAELEPLFAKLSDEHKRALDGIPIDRQIQLARALGATTNGAVGAPAGKGTSPAGGDAKAKLTAYAKKGVANLTKEERDDMRALLSESDIE